MSQALAFVETLNELMQKVFKNFEGGQQNALAYEMRILSTEVAKEVNFPVV